MNSLRLLAFLLAAATLGGLLDATPQVPPFAQNWSNAGLITTNDVWIGVPGIRGFRGDNLTSGNGVDPQTILAPGDTTPVNVIANQANPNTLADGGVAEFDGIANRVVALQGSGTADAPHIEIYLNTAGLRQIRVSYNLRDVDGSNDNAVTPVAAHYRVGTTGRFANLPAAYVPDATTGPNLATQVTAVVVTLPSAADNRALVTVRVMTTNAVGTDEWVGIDDISVTALPLPVQLASFTARAGPEGSVQLRWVTLTETNNFGFQVQRRTGEEGAFADVPGGFVEGNGTTTEPREYAFVDTPALSGVLWYRLKQIDLDGTVHLLDPVRVEVPAAVVEAVPLAFELHQNHPNPFNPTTTIAYDLAAPGTVTLTVHDLAGREVAVLVNGLQDAGRQTALFDARGIASGVYFYRLDVRPGENGGRGGFTAVRKLVLLR